MSGADRLQQAPFLDDRPNVASHRGDVGEVGQQVDLRDGGAAPADAPGGAQDELPQLLGHLLLDFDATLVRRQDAAFEVLQFRSGEPLCVHQRLLALIVARDAAKIRLGDLDVVAEDRVEAHFERRDAGAGALALLDAGDRLAPGVADGAKVVQFCVHPGLDDSAIGQREWRLGNDGGLDPALDVFQSVETFPAASPERGVERVESQA